jgi:hypothetical protein
VKELLAKTVKHLGCYAYFTVLHGIGIVVVDDSNKIIMSYGERRTNPNATAISLGIVIFS